MTPTWQDLLAEGLSDDLAAVTAHAKVLEDLAVEATIDAQGYRELSVTALERVQALTVALNKATATARARAADTRAVRAELERERESHRRLREAVMRAERDAPTPEPPCQP